MRIFEKNIILIVLSFSFNYGFSQDFKFKYYPNGLIKEKIDNLHNLSFEYYENGQIRKICNNFSQSTVDAISSVNIEWYDTGIIKLQTVQTNDTVIFQYEYYPSGKIFRIYTYRYFSRHGIIDAFLDYEKRFYENGQLIYEAYLDNGIQPYIEYYEDGKVKAKGSFDGLYFHGEFVAYYNNGKIKETGSYGDTGNNIKIGIWKNYDENGVLIKEDNFDKKTDN